MFTLSATQLRDMTLTNSLGTSSNTVLVNVFTENTLKQNNVNFKSENLSSSLNNESSNNFAELSNSFRFTRFNNPLISYDYKCGNYLGI